MDSKNVLESPFVRNSFEQHYVPYNATVADYAYHNGFTKTTDGGKW